MAIDSSRRLRKLISNARGLNRQSQQKRFTEAEAKKIVQVARRGGITAGERAIVGKAIAEFGNRMDFAAEAQLRRVSNTNGTGSVRAQFRKAAANGSVNVNDARAIRREMAKDGFTQAERAELIRSLFFTNQRVTVTQGAFDVFHGIRVTRDRQVRDPYNLPLPVGPGDDGNRLLNPRRANAPGMSFEQKQRFPIRGNTPLLDGAGNVRGRVAAGSVMINSGQRKLIAGQPHVYAFATTIARPDGRRMGASGWIPEAALTEGPLHFMPTATLPKPPGGDRKGSYTITGGNPRRFGDLKVNPKIPRSENVAASDYLKRAGNVVNMLWALPFNGGVSNDTFPVGTKFIRSAGVPPKKVALYQPMGTKVVAQMSFVYGRVGERYGWIALDALKANRS